MGIIVKITDGILTILYPRASENTKKAGKFTGQNAMFKTTKMRIVVQIICRKLRRRSGKRIS